MKNLPSALAAHIATRNTTLATALKITRADGAVYGFTTHDVDDEVYGVIYRAKPGLAVSDIVLAANAAVGNLQLTTLHDGTVFTTADVLGGKWRNAAFTIFRYNWAAGDGVYCTFDPAKGIYESDASVSFGVLQGIGGGTTYPYALPNCSINSTGAYSTGSWASAAPTLFQSSGKFYCEFHSAGNGSGFGIANPSWLPADFPGGAPLGTTANSMGVYFGWAGGYYSGVSTLVNGVSTHVSMQPWGECNSLLVDLDAGTAEVWLQGVSIGVVLTGITGLWGPAGMIQNLKYGSGLTIVCDPRQFQFTPPIGYKPWVAGGRDDIDTLLSGTLGEFTLLRNSVTAELRDFRQYLQQSVGDASSITCRARLGDARCKQDLTAFTYTGAITSVTDTQTFADSSRTEAAQWFNEGLITFTSGDNNGISAKVKTFAAGAFTLAIPLILPVLVGDAYIAIAGCMKRVDEDCHDKFDNAVNFVGEPHRKGINDLTQPANIAVIA